LIVFLGLAVGIDPTVLLFEDEPHRVKASTSWSMIHAAPTRPPTVARMTTTGSI